MKQLDKQREAKTIEFEEDVLAFEGQFQTISLETQALQDKYRGALAAANRTTPGPPASLT